MSKRKKRQKHTKSYWETLCAHPALLVASMALRSRAGSSPSSDGSLHLRSQTLHPGCDPERWHEGYLAAYSPWGRKTITTREGQRDLGQKNPRKHTCMLETVKFVNSITLSTV